VKGAWLGVAALSAVALTPGLAGSGTASVEPLPQSFCSPIVYGGNGEPQFVVASDLPVVAFQYRDTTARMQNAIKFILARHQFRAGKYGVAYQACDDSTSATDQGDLTRCAANAKAYAQDASLIGVLGTWNSRCSEVELPLLNQAPSGPLALVSPSNTNVGLTHAGPGTGPGEPGLYYPTGKRSFARVISADDAQGAADALLTKRLHVRRVVVLDDRESYGVTVVTPFMHAARALGLKVVSRASWGEDQKDFAALARRVAAAKPDAVFLGGYACPTCGTLIKQLRAALGARPLLIGPDGWEDVAALAEVAGPASRGMYVTVPGLPPSRMGPLGRRIAAKFGAGKLGSGGPPYAAEATEVLLAAIARSSGTRASVAAQLYKLRVSSGILGSFRFDRNGDPTLNPVTVFRVVGVKATFNRVVTVPANLIR
jgi:branched-chain amino acid transport system substrate-binding protein